MDNKTKLRIGGTGPTDHCRIKPHHRSDRRFMAAGHPVGRHHRSRCRRRFRLDFTPSATPIPRAPEKFDIDPEKGRINEANLRRMYHSGGQHQKDAITLVCLSQKCSVDEAHAIFKKTSDPSGNEPNGCPTGTRSKTSTSLIPTVTGRLNIPLRFRRPVFISIKPISVSIAL